MSEQNPILSAEIYTHPTYKLNVYLLYIYMLHTCTHGKTKAVWLQSTVFWKDLHLLLLNGATVPNQNSLKGDFQKWICYSVSGPVKSKNMNKRLNSTIMFLLDTGFDRSNEICFSVWFKVFLRVIIKEEFQKHSVKWLLHWNK